MISLVHGCLYLPIHRWKLGEAQSLHTIEGHIADRTLPMFEVPPSSGWDYEHLRVFTAAEHIKFFGTRLGSFWAGRPVLVDAQSIDRQRLGIAVATHPLTALLERARQCHVLGYPVVGLSSTQEYIDSARQYLSRNDHLGFCLRISVSSFDAPAWSAKMEALASAIGQRPEKGILLIDNGPLGEWDEDFVTILIDAINHIPFLKQWAAVFFASTSFPERRSTPVGEVGRFPRSDMLLYRALLDRESELLRVPGFSDYGPSYPSPFKKGGGIPRAHLRFTSARHYLVGEGPSTEGVGFKAIHDVAKALAKQDEFRDCSLSKGVAFMRELADQAVGPGNPAKWRWGAADHHTTVVVHEQAGFHRVALHPAAGKHDNRQMDLEPLMSTANTLNRTVGAER